MDSRRDARSPVTRAQLDRHYADPDRDIWGLTLHDNIVLEGQEHWTNADSEGFALLNSYQRRLYYAGVADGEIGNGGFGQLVSNFPELLHDMRQSFENMGCVEVAALFARELVRLESAGGKFISDLINAKTRFRGVNAPELKHDSWSAFIEFCDEYYKPLEGSDLDPVSEQYLELQPVTHAAIHDYIRRNESEFFRIIG